jgi:hypothetical protein
MEQSCPVLSLATGDATPNGNHEPAPLKTELLQVKDTFTYSAGGN